MPAQLRFAFASRQHWEEGAEYRHRYAQHRTDPQLQAGHAVAPWLVVFDDHEVENN